MSLILSRRIRSSEAEHRLQAKLKMLDRTVRSASDFPRNENDVTRLEGPIRTY